MRNPEDTSSISDPKSRLSFFSAPSEMRVVELNQNDQLQLKMLGRNSFEVNGQIAISPEGRVTKINHRKGQMMQPCLTGCVLNFHTHPPDYQTLYPDHPSATDFKYIHTATCKMKELSAHIVCTPKFLYVIYYKCSNPMKQLWDFFTIGRKIDKKFSFLANNWDRSSESFRKEYIKEMREIGFHVERFSWNDTMAFYVPEFKYTLYQKVALLALFVYAAYVVFFK